jgi:hypothetical protein
MADAAKRAIDTGNIESLLRALGGIEIALVMHKSATDSSSS